MFSHLHLLLALLPALGFIQVPPDSTGKQVATATPGAGAHRQFIVVTGDQNAGEIARVLNTAPDPADSTAVYGMVVRAMLRRFGAVISTTPLGSIGQFLQAWQEVNVEGTAYVGAAARADQAGTVFIEETDDSTDANFTRTVVSAAVGSNTTVRVYGVIRARFWRIRYDNGAGVQTTFKATAVAGNLPAYAIDANGNLTIGPAAGATFPVSAASLPLPTGASTETTLGGIKTGTDKIPASPAQEHATAVSPSAVRLTDGTVFFKPTTPADTQPVSAASLPLPTGASTAAKQPALGTSGTPSADVITVQGAAAMTAVKVDGSAVTQPVSGTVTAAQAVAANLQATITPPAITKGTQGATGVSTQDLKDAGRTYIVITLDRTTGITSEALATMTINKNGTVTTGSSYTVTTGKTLRITAIHISIRATTTTLVSGRVRVRSAAAVSATSGIILNLETASFSANSESIGVADLAVPDGIEIAAAQQIGVSHIESSSSSTVTITLTGFEY